MVLPRLVRQALHNETLQVFGDGTQTRCFCHVDDVTDALLALLKEPSAEGQVFNVGAREEISIHHLAQRIIAIVESSSSIEFVPYEQAYEAGFEDMQRRRPDISKVTSAVGWTPTRDLDSIIRDVAEGLRSRTIS